MQTAVLNTAPRQGDIDGFSGQTGVKRCAFLVPGLRALRACQPRFAALPTALAAGRPAADRVGVVI